MRSERRRFLQGGAALAGLFALPAPLRAQQGRARVAAVEAFTVPAATYVKVTADDGTFGWGEAGRSGHAMVSHLINRQMAEAVIGDDVFAGEASWARLLFEFDELGPAGLVAQAIAGIDWALWDLRGKLLGQPVWALLGGRHRDSFPLYGSFSIDTGDGGRMTPEEAGRRAAELAGEGFTAIKVRLGIREENADPDPDPAIPVTRAVRAAIGDEVGLYVDANNGYRAARAIEVGRRLAGEFGVSVFEEPVAAFHYASMAEVAAALDLAVAAGEHEYTPFAFRDLIGHGRPDVLNPDISKVMGLTGGLHVATLAEVFDKPISVHNARPTLLTAAHVHYVARARTATRPQEHPGSRRLAQLWDYFENRLVPQNGRMAVPDTPGLGLVVREAAVRAAAV